MPTVEALEKILETIAGSRHSGLRIDEGDVSLVLDVSGLSQLERDKMDIAIKQALRQQGGAQTVKIAMTAEKVKRRLIAVGSGKGGVGKSTVSTNLAIALMQAGHKTGMVDADIYGPSQTRLLDCPENKPEIHDKKLVPITTPSGIKLLSMGQLIEQGRAIAWRGPMAGKALAQLIDADWGDVTDLVIDLPPGTGDVQMSLMQQFKPDGAVIVSTPQDLALIDATRAINLFDQGSIPIIGLIENMAGYICPNCGEISDPFGAGGAEAAAQQMNLPFLGRIPLDIAIRQTSDAGTPIAAIDCPQAAAFRAIAAKTVARLDDIAKAPPPAPASAPGPVADAH
ncbi:P-loop NTPase [Parasphingorhabdus sp. DH2-15]|uniref:P-loop NTPase n=1 Tax=Parasphingorhabdus sp. DH2-15 TaxID=3444112 RepID=UPI003F6886E2